MKSYTIRNIVKDLFISIPRLNPSSVALLTECFFLLQEELLFSTRQIVKSSNGDTAEVPLKDHLIYQMNILTDLRQYLIILQFLLSHQFMNQSHVFMEITMEEHTYELVLNRCLLSMSMSMFRVISQIAIFVNIVLDVV